MSGKKPQANQSIKAQMAAAAAPVVKKEAIIHIKGWKVASIKVARGTARAIRRAGLVRNWRTIKGAKQMLPSAQALAAAVTA